MRLKRLGRPSGTGALESLGFLGDSPIDLEDRLRAVVELRPQRPEECYDYSIFRWSRRIVIAAVAARFSGVWIGSGGLANDPDALHVVESLRWHSGQPGLLTVGALPAYANAVSGGMLAADNRIVNAGAVELYQGMWQGGDLAAVPGVNYDALNGAAATGAYDEVFVNHVLRAVSPATADGLLVTCGTVNTLANVTVRGYTITSR